MGLTAALGCKKIPEPLHWPSGKIYGYAKGLSLYWMLWLDETPTAVILIVFQDLLDPRVALAGLLIDQIFRLGLAQFKGVSHRVRGFLTLSRLWCTLTQTLLFLVDCGTNSRTCCTAAMPAWLPSHRP